MNNSICKDNEIPVDIEVFQELQEDAAMYRHLLDVIYYASIACNNERIGEIVHSIAEVGRSTQGEYTEEEKEERAARTYLNFKKVIGYESD